MARIFFVIFITPLLVSCAQYQWRNTNPSANFNVDYGACSNEATTRIKRQIAVAQIVIPNAPNAYTTKCNNSSNSTECTTQAQQNFTDNLNRHQAEMSRIQQQGIFDGNYNRQVNEYVTNCLMSRGWQQYRLK